MSDEKPTIEEAREIIKVRRVSAKPTPEKKNDEAEAAKAREAELQKRLRRLQIFLSVAVIELLILGLRSLGCFPSPPISPPRGASPPVASDVPPSPTNASAKTQSAPEFRRLFSPAPGVSDALSSISIANDALSPYANAAGTAGSLDELRVVRIATWNLEPLVFSKVTNVAQGEKIAEIIREFDVVAVQGVRSKNRAVLEGLVYLIARQGGEYDYVASSPSSREPTAAVFFNAQTIVVDRASISEVYDAQGRLRAPALVANFSPRNVEPEKRFTFQIINLQLFGDETDDAAFVDLLATLKKRAGGFGLSEDDLIVAGDFGVAIQKIKELADTSTYTAPSLACTGDNEVRAHIFFDSLATIEYVDRCGAVDLAEYFNISEEAAVEIARRGPIWCDFSIYEGGASDFFTPSFSD